MSHDFHGIVLIDSVLLQVYTIIHSLNLIYLRRKIMVSHEWGYLRLEKSLLSALC